MRFALNPTHQRRKFSIDRIADPRQCIDLNEQRDRAQSFLVRRHLQPRSTREAENVQTMPAKRRIAEMEHGVFVAKRYPQR